MQVTMSYNLKKNQMSKESLKFLLDTMKIAKKLYNQMLYYCIQWQKFYGKIPSMFDLNIMLNKENQPYKQFIKTDVSDSTLQTYYGVIQSFFKSIIDYYKNPSKYMGKPKLPKFKENDDTEIENFNRKDINYFCIRGRNVKLEQDKIIITNTKKKLNYEFLVPYGRLNEYIVNSVNQIRFYPEFYDCVRVEVVYTTQEESMKLENDRVLSIDLGSKDNFAACVSNIKDFQPFLLSAGEIKSINNFYHQHLKDNYQSYEMMRYKVNGNTNTLKKWELNRKYQLKEIFHAYSKYIIEVCKKNNINTIIVGENKGWKQNIKQKNKNKKTKKGKYNPMYYKNARRNFVEVPFDMFKKQLEYKCKLAGINYIDNEESYTSLTDNLAKENLKEYKEGKEFIEIANKVTKAQKKGNASQDDINKIEKFKGNRIHRGFFKSSTGVFINADINGAIGIMRKVVGDKFIDEIKNNKKIFYPIKLTYKKIIHISFLVL